MEVLRGIKMWYKSEGEDSAYVPVSSAIYKWYFGEKILCIALMINFEFVMFIYPCT